MAKFKHAVVIETDDSSFYQWLKLVLPDMADCRIREVSDNAN